MTIKLIIACSLLLSIAACVISPYGEGPGYRGAYYGNPSYDGYYGHGGYGGREGFYRGDEERHGDGRR
jgi:hypothetical protein